MIELSADEMATRSMIVLTEWKKSRPMRMWRWQNLK
jgi:hypothetical protein